MKLFSHFFLIRDYLTSKKTMYRIATNSRTCMFWLFEGKPLCPVQFLFFYVDYILDILKCLNFKNYYCQYHEILPLCLNELGCLWLEIYPVQVLLYVRAGVLHDGFHHSRGHLKLLHTLRSTTGTPVGFQMKAKFQNQ